MTEPAVVALERMFYPRRLAVVGASETVGKAGTVLMRNLETYGGEIIPITKSGRTVAGRPAYSSLDEAPTPIDLAVVAVPAEAVRQVIKEAGTAGIRTAIVISGGFAEAGPRGRVLQDELMETARAAGVRIVGPNCLGILNCNTGLNISLTSGSPPYGGQVALVTQSGAYGMAVSSMASEEHLGFSKVYAAGNKADFTDAEVLQYLARDGDTEVICFFLESVRGGRDFLRQVASVTQDKPVVIAKVGRTAAGTRAATSHTAAIAGRMEVWRDVLTQAGAVVVQTGEQLLDVARALDFQPLPRGRRVGIITNSGGIGVELTDLLEEQGLEVPELTQATQSLLRERLPPYGSARNPVDMTAVWSRFLEIYPLITASLVRCGEVDSVVVVLLQRSALDPKIVEALAQAVRGLRDSGEQVPVYVCWVAPRGGDVNKDRLQQMRIPCFEGPERTARAVAGAVKAADAKRSAWRPSAEAIAGAPSRSLPDGVLGYEAAAALLREFGIGLVPWRVCRTAKEALSAARDLGYPVVAKTLGAVHKTEVGGVRTGLTRPSQLRGVVRALLKLGPEVLIQKQADGVEMMVGGIKDPELGPLVMVGAGGTLVELIQDVRFMIAPVGATEAERAVRSLRCFPLLEGFRGTRPADLAAFTGCVSAVSQLLAAMPEVDELDLNPVLVSPSGALAADVRLIARHR